MSDKYLYILTKGFKIFRTDAKQNFASIITLATLLFLYMAVFTVNHSVSSAIGAISDSQTVRVFITDEADGKTLLTGIEKIFPDGTARYYDKAAAKQRVIALSPNSENLKDLPEELFPRFFEIKMQTNAQLHILNGSNMIARLDGVKSVENGKKMNERLQQIKTTSGMFVFMLTLLTGISCAFIIFNTIRLILFRHHKAIMIYTLVGATRYFITLPYIVASKLEVTISFLLAWFMNHVFVTFVTGHLLSKSFFTLSAPSLWTDIGLYLVLICIAVFSTIFCVITFLIRQKSINEI